MNGKDGRMDLVPADVVVVVFPRIARQYTSCNNKQVLISVKGMPDEL
jgi:chemotaxis protein histidine kinase CheA